MSVNFKKDYKVYYIRKFTGADFISQKIARLPNSQEKFVVSMPLTLILSIFLIFDIHLGDFGEFLHPFIR